MTLNDLFQALEDTDIAAQMRESDFLYPSVESLHVVALALVVGSIATVDLRLLGVAGRKTPVTQMSREILPWTWGAFALAVATGGLLFVSNAAEFAGNTPFQLKMGLLALAGCNMIFFHFVTWRSAATWDTAIPPPAPVKLAGALSLLFWIGVVAAGRWIGFTVG